MYSHCRTIKLKLDTRVGVRCSSNSAHQTIITHSVYVCAAVVTRALHVAAARLFDKRATGMAVLFLAHGICLTMLLPVIGCLPVVVAKKKI